MNPVPEKPRLSVIICTRNRCEMLRSCLDSLFEQTTPAHLYEIVVVDNGSADATPAMLRTLVTQKKLIKVAEPQPGLSHARNAGLKAARADWVLYIDDDAKAYPNLVEQALFTIRNYNFQAFGGRFFHWFRYGRPRWFPDNFEGGGHVHPTDRPIALDNDFFNGGIMVFQKAVLEAVGAFNGSYGMIASTIGYGEECEVQLRLRAMNCNLGYDPSLCIDHLVAPYKLQLRWHIKSKFAHGRDEAGIYFSRFPWHTLLYNLGRIGLVNLPKALVKLLIRRQYYWQNAVLETIGAAAYQIGRYVGAKRLRATAE